MTINQKIIIITDLDGTLLDHETYEFVAARPALEQIKQYSIPLIINSSKTAAEIMRIRKSLNNNDSFVVENGAGIYLAEKDDEYEIIRFGKDRKEILAVLDQLKQKLKLSFTGFNDMTDEELAACTGLTKEQAVLAKQRDFTEPLQWQDNDQKWEVFTTELKKADLGFAKGGRFISISSKVDKGQCLKWLRQYYQKKFNTPPVIIALGDSENDKQMLEAADYAVLVKSPAHDFPQINADNLIYTIEYGPQGWNNSIIKLLNTINKTA